MKEHLEMVRLIPGPAFSCQSQAQQYSYRDAPGIHLQRHILGELGHRTVID
jgi:hypothetical protein